MNLYGIFGAEKKRKKKRTPNQINKFDIEYSINVYEMKKEPPCAGKSI